MAYLIDRIQASLQKEGFASRSRESRDWLRTKVANLKPTKASLMNDLTRLRERSIIGRLYFFVYDPKTKEKMKYYDTFPLVLPIERYADGFLGLNIHYIHPKQRLILMDKLSSYATNDKFDNTTKLRLTYQTLKSASKIFEKNACIKRYLFTQIQSRFLEIGADEWDIAALLPVESFTSEKKPISKSQVFQDSKELF
jgi:hypothetical protein